MEHNYPLYIVIWFAISVIALLLFKTIPRKMKSIEDRQNKSSLFTILIFTGLPLVMIAILGPLVFIIGDKNMEVSYKIIWGVLVFVFVVYFFIKQRPSKH